MFGASGYATCTTNVMIHRVSTTAAVAGEASRALSPRRTGAGSAIVRGLPALLALPAALACGGQGATAPSPDGTASVAVSPATATLAALGQTVRLEAQVLDRSGKLLADAPIAWSSGDEAVASVDRDGLVTANGNGVAAVEAASGGVRGHALVTVEQRAARIDISPLPDTLRSLGDTVRLAAGGVDANGHSMPQRQFRWASSDTTVASVDSVGLVTATGNGSASVSAAIGDTASRVNVVVYDTIARDIARDRAALAALYSATNGDGWDRAANWLGDEPLSTWYGVSTDSLGRVARLTLPSNSLSGPLPPEIGDLANLEELRLGNGAIRWIPPEIGQLPRLKILHLHNNVLAGQIPSTIGRLTNLVSLDLRANRLAGPIPPELGELTNLEYLDLSFNRLDGPIPPELGDLTRLTWLYAYRNGLTGPVPSELGRLANLRHLGLGENYLEGPLPSELGNLANLTSLTLFRAGLTGPLPSQLGDLADLERLDLHGNRLTGPIPPELGDLANLNELSLGANHFTGAIPVTLGGLVELTTLDVSLNRDLSGPLPADLTALVKLERLYIQGTTLCVPATPAFSQWLATVGAFNGRRCSG